MNFHANDAEADTYCREPPFSAPVIPCLQTSHCPSPTGNSFWSSCNDRAAKVILFDGRFVEQWNSDPVVINDDDRSAAARLRIQLVSRITTQRLPYVDGEEVTALTSVYRLFDLAREIFSDHPRSSVTDAVVWHVMNTHVRPFTAKWHRQSERGALAALDATDIFRHELAILQKYLLRFDALLVAIRDGTSLKIAEPGNTGREAAIEAEMDEELSRGIPDKLGGLDTTTAQNLNMAEDDAVSKRRAHYAARRDLIASDEEGRTWVARPHAAALAISGGGIRSATFALGVLAALARRNLLYQFDYLSTVSGGGYLGSFLTTFLSASAPADIKGEIGLARDDLPFKRDDGEAAALRHVRHHSKYLATGRLWERLQMAGAQVYGMAMNGLGFAYVAFVAAFAEYMLRLIPLPYGSWTAPVIIVALALATTPFVVPLIRKASPSSNLPDKIVAGLFVVLVALLAWQALGLLHACAGDPKWLMLFAAVPLLASALLALANNLPMPISYFASLLAVAAIAAPRAVPRHRAIGIFPD